MFTYTCTCTISHINFIPQIMHYTYIVHSTQVDIRTSIYMYMYMYILGNTLSLLLIECAI